VATVAPPTVHVEEKPAEAAAPAEGAAAAPAAPAPAAEKKD
jgi:hypothetical protein